jgi:hypothetical protein
VDGSINSAAIISCTNSTVQGTGVAGAITSSGGTLAPGYTIGSTASGTLTASGNVSLDSASSFNIRLGVSGTNSGDNDQLAITNGAAATLSGTLNITLGSGLSGLTAGNTYGLVYVILNGGYSSASSGTFSGYTINGLAAALSGNTLTAGGVTLEIEYGYGGSDDTFDTGSSDGADVALDLIGVPEPGTWAMLICGAGMLLIRRRRRRRFL